MENKMFQSDQTSRNYVYIQTNDSQTIQSNAIEKGNVLSEMNVGLDFQDRLKIPFSSEGQNIERTTFEENGNALDSKDIRNVCCNFELENAQKDPCLDVQSEQQKDFKGEKYIENGRNISGKHENPNVWDNLKIPPAVMKSMADSHKNYVIVDEQNESSNTPKEKGNLKIKFKFQNNLKVPSPVKSSKSLLRRQLESPNFDLSNASDVMSFSVDLPDTLKQSLKEIVQKEFAETTDGLPKAKRKKENKDKQRNHLGKIIQTELSHQEGGVTYGVDNPSTVLSHLEGGIKYAVDNPMVSIGSNSSSSNVLLEQTSKGAYGEEISLSNYPLTTQGDSTSSANFKDTQIPISQLDKPRRYGQRPQICGHCGKLFLDPYNFKQHLLIHTGEKPFKCDICGRGFSRNNHLTRHILIHTGEKPYHCDICGSDFSRSSTLALHKRSHTNEKNYNCKICGKDFTLYWNLVVHLRIHTGERPFKCEICHKTSRQKSDFNRHMKTHSGEKPFTCFSCNTKFSRSSCLKRHWNKFHPGRPLEENVSPENETEEQIQNFSSLPFTGEQMYNHNEGMQMNGDDENEEVFSVINESSTIVQNDEHVEELKRIEESSPFVEEDEKEEELNMIKENSSFFKVNENEEETSIIKEGITMLPDSENDRELNRVNDGELNRVNDGELNRVIENNNVVQVDDQTYEFTFDRHDRNESLTSDVEVPDTNYTMYITDKV